ncbi:permease prefix domain 1-containing protein [Actinomyces bowdenii]|uniref:permease prefix domain 1-containing protein n=1 Tax=Actinomyces bowdenii TaxID=131109 RepID=UPI00214B2A3A|nr:permease prefix domain 1-containing protein [Actinomyces bowdenii]MCR2051561.1 permease prefix domain 1-containing protein [Actinomyces bowdenii]
MDTIDSFLDAMFAPYPASPRLNEAKAELRAMMEDAYNDALASGRTRNEAIGQVITDFGNLEELAPVLGISAELRADDGISPAEPPADPAYPTVTLPQAQALATARRSTASTLGHAISAFVVAPAMLIALTGLAGSGRIAVSEPVANVIGLAFTLTLVALGVVMLVRRRPAFDGVRHLIEGRFTRDPIVSAWAARERQNHEQERSRKLATAVFLWTMSALPPLAGVLLISGSRDGSSGMGGVATALSLLLIAAGLQIYLPATWASSTYTTLTAQGRPAAGRAAAGRTGELQWQEEHEGEDKDLLLTLVSSIFWPACVIVYLLWSFLWDSWDRSWLIWPVAGLAFGAFAGARSAWRQQRRSAAIPEAH